MKRRLWEILCLWVCYIFYFSLNLWKRFVSLSCFHISNFPTILGNWFFFYKSVTNYLYQQFAHLIFRGTLNISVPLKSPHIYNTLMVGNNILFLILATSDFSASFLLTSGNEMFSNGIPFWANVLEGIKDRNASICLFLFS